MSSIIRKEIESLISNISTDDDKIFFSTTISFPENFTGFKGHFIEQKILPGICQIEASIATLAKVIGSEIRLKALKKAKFLNPILPEEEITIKGEIISRDKVIDAKFTVVKTVENKLVTISRLRLKGEIKS